MREFVNGLAAKALRGEALSPTQLGAFDVQKVRHRVREFQRAHPEVAAPYVALFRDLDDLLDMVNRASAS